MDWIANGGWRVVVAIVIMICLGLLASQMPGIIETTITDPQLTAAAAPTRTLEPTVTSTPTVTPTPEFSPEVYAAATNAALAQTDGVDPSSILEGAEQIVGVVSVSLDETISCWDGTTYTHDITRFLKISGVNFMLEGKGADWVMGRWSRRYFVSPGNYELPAETGWVKVGRHNVAYNALSYLWDIGNCTRP